ncbi:hypothetical protein WAK64_17995 [Bacillus spongiae]|uniref:Uncharacterized protein n=1 Tax=Bacillus spongiae TaxID=2683610 RepID=A0ABU8HHS2_9BACI
MENKLREVLSILEKLNSKTNIVTTDDIDDQYDNLEDLKVLSSELDKVLSGFKTVNLNDSTKVKELLFEFHRILNTFEWHFSEISDLNMKIIQKYKDKV